MLKGEFAKKEEQFWKDIEQLRKRQAENTKNENIQELLQNLRLQLMEAQEKITSLNCEKQEVEASFRMKVNQLAELQKIHNEAVEEIETVPVLKLQVFFFINYYIACRHIKHLTCSWTCTRLILKLKKIWHVR